MEQNIEEVLKKTKVDVLRKVLQENGVDASSLVGKDNVKKAVLNNEQAIKDILNMEEVFDTSDDGDFEIESESTTNDKVSFEEQKMPSPNDEGWTTYVLEHLHNDELYEGRPTVDGLRRIAEQFLGECVSSKTHVVQSPHKENGWHCTVVKSLTFVNNGRVKEFDGVAGASVFNTSAPFNKYPESMAETRAEGRALRVALKLKVGTKEEIDEQANLPDSMIENPLEFTSRITPDDQQKLGIKMMATRLDINVQKLFEKVLGTEINKESFTKEAATQLISSLSQYQKDINKIDDELKGYNSTWESC